jgi:SPP1 gp7 family putative phage head morphogenesis protein
MPAAPNLGYAFGLEPKAAVAYFEQLGYKVTDDWKATADAVRGKAFAVSKGGSLDVLKDIKSGLIQSAKTGETQRSFVERMGGILQAKGWDPDSASRLKTIFRTNMQSAYMAGRWEQFQANKASRPYLQYVAVMDGVTRPSHAAMNGLVFHIDDPIWRTHYPPCGYNCRCRVRSLSAFQLKQLKLTVLDSSGDTFTELVNVGQGRQAEVFGYRTPSKPVRIAQKDSVPGSFPKVERGQTLLWEPDQDPNWVEGEGPDWKVENRRVAMRTDPGFGFNQGRWDEAGEKPDLMPGKPAAGGTRFANAVRIMEGQPTWRESGRPSLRNVAKSDLNEAPPMMPSAKPRSAAAEMLAETLQVSVNQPLRVVSTPIELVQLDYQLLAATVAAGAGAERYGLHMLSTLANPFEVYLTEYEDGFRTRYIGVFQGAAKLMIVGRVNKDGTVFWEIVEGDALALDQQRVGQLLYPVP